VDKESKSIVVLAENGDDNDEMAAENTPFSHSHLARQKRRP